MFAMRRIDTLILCAVAVLCISCSGNLGDRKSNNLYFRVSTTRGAAITTDSFNETGKTFILNAYLESEGRTVEDDAKPRYITDAVFTYDKSNTKWSATGCTWRNQVATNFWCYSPATLTNGTREFTHCGTATDDQEKTMSFTYTMPADPENGKGAEILEDMIYAYAHKSFDLEHRTANDNVVDIAFQHAVSAIRFKKGTFMDGYTLKSIEIEGFNTSGTCTMTGNPVATGSDGIITFTWSDLSTPAAGYLQNITDAQLTAGDMTTGDKVFMVIPQQLTDAVKVNVTFDHEGVDVTKTASLGGTAVTWVAGKYYSYLLKFTGETDLTATLEDFNGGNWDSHTSGDTNAGQLSGKNW